MVKPCENCGHDSFWLQVKADGSGRLGVRDVRIQGLSVDPGGWRAAFPNDLSLKDGGVYCPVCKAPAPANIVEAFKDTPTLWDEPLVFVDPENVDLDAEVGAIRATYKEGVVDVLESEPGCEEKTVAVSSLEWLHSAVTEALARRFDTSSQDLRLYEHQYQAIDTLVSECGVLR